MVDFVLSCVHGLPVALHFQRFPLSLLTGGLLYNPLFASEAIEREFFFLESQTLASKPENAYTIGGMEVILGFNVPWDKSHRQYVGQARSERKYCPLAGRYLRGVGVRGNVCINTGLGESTVALLL